MKRTALKRILQEVELVQVRAAQQAVRNVIKKLWFPRHGINLFISGLFVKLSELYLFYTTSNGRFIVKNKL
jgi:hypothetical protein